MSTAVSIRLPNKVAKKLDSVAHDTERSRSFIVQKAVEFYLDDFADLQIALDRLRDTTDEIISSKDMRKSLGV